MSRGILIVIHNDSYIFSDARQILDGTPIKDFLRALTNTDPFQLNCIIKALQSSFNIDISVHETEQEEKSSSANTVAASLKRTLDNNCGYTKSRT